MKRLPAPDILIREWLQNPHAITVAAFVIAGVFLGLAGCSIQRNLRHNEPGLRAPCALPFALIIAAAGVFGAWRLPSPYDLVVGATLCALAGLLFYFADHRRWVRDPAGKIVADRWQVVLAFAGFRWTRDKANRHFFFSGDTGSGKTSGMNGLLRALMSRNPTMGGLVMANKGDEWFYLEWLAKKYGRTHDIISLRPAWSVNPLHNRTASTSRLLFATPRPHPPGHGRRSESERRNNLLKVKEAGHIGPAFELLSDIGCPVAATNAYNLLTSKKELKAALDQLTKKELSLRRIQLAEIIENITSKAEPKNSGPVNLEQNDLEYLGTPEVAEVFGTSQPDGILNQEETSQIASHLFAPRHST